LNPTQFKNFKNPNLNLLWAFHRTTGTRHWPRGDLEDTAGSSRPVAEVERSSISLQAFSLITPCLLTPYSFPAWNFQVVSSSGHLPCLPFWPIKGTQDLARALTTHLDLPDILYRSTPSSVKLIGAIFPVEHRLCRRLAPALPSLPRRGSCWRWPRWAPPSPGHSPVTMPPSGEPPRPPPPSAVSLSQSRSGEEDGSRQTDPPLIGWPWFPHTPSGYAAPHFLLSLPREQTRQMGRPRSVIRPILNSSTHMFF
jgi:hypothetical protein